MSRRNRPIWLFAALLLCSSTAMAQDWGGGNKINPGERRSYDFTAASSPDSVSLDARKCGTTVFSYDDDTVGTNTAAGATLKSCPNVDSLEAQCISIKSWTADDTEEKSSARPGFFRVYVDSAPSGSGNTRVEAFCAVEVAATAGGAGGGDVSGPGASTNNAVVVWDGAAGTDIKVLADGTVGQVLTMVAGDPAFADAAQVNVLIDSDGDGDPDFVKVTPDYDGTAAGDMQLDIQAAYDALTDTSAKMILIGAGTYECHAPIDDGCFQLLSNTTVICDEGALLRGMEVDEILVSEGPNGKPVITGDDDGNNILTDITVMNCRLDGAAPTGLIGIATDGGNSTLEDTSETFVGAFDGAAWGNEIVLRPGQSDREVASIASFTANELTRSGTWTANPVAGDTYYITYSNALVLASLNRMGFGFDNVERLRLINNHVSQTGHACYYGKNLKDSLFHSNVGEMCGGFFDSDGEVGQPCLYFFADSGGTMDGVIVSDNICKYSVDSLYNTRENDATSLITNVTFSNNHGTNAYAADDGIGPGVVIGGCDNCQVIGNLMDSVANWYTFQETTDMLFEGNTGLNALEGGSAGIVINTQNVRLSMIDNVGRTTADARACLQMVSSWSGTIDGLHLSQCGGEGIESTISAYGSRQWDAMNWHNITITDFDWVDRNDSTEHDGIRIGGVTLNGSPNMDMVASTGVITRASGDFTTDGFRVGMRVVTTGFASGGNNGTFLATAVGTTTMTIEPADATLVNATADSGVDIVAETQLAGIMENIVIRSGTGRGIDFESGIDGLVMENIDINMHMTGFLGVMGDTPAAAQTCDATTVDNWLILNEAATAIDCTFSGGGSLENACICDGSSFIELTTQTIGAGIKIASGTSGENILRHIRLANMMTSEGEGIDLPADFTGALIEDVLALETRGVTLEWAMDSAIETNGSSGNRGREIRCVGTDTTSECIDSIIGLPKKCNVSVETAVAADDIMCGQATANLRPVALCCIGTGSPTDHDVLVAECDDGGGSCTTVGLEVAVSNNTETCDTTPTDTQIDVGNWYQIATDSIGTAADLIHCELSYHQ